MKTIETQERFIEMRAEGASFEKIAKALEISKGTCSSWEKEFKERIAEGKGEKLKALYETFNMTKEARIKALGSTIKRMEDAIAGIDLTTLPPEKLLDLNLKYREMLKSEYVEPCKEIDLDQIRNPKQILVALADLLNRTRSGGIDDKQAGKEATVLANLLKAYEMTELNDKVDAIQATMSVRN